MINEGNWSKDKMEYFITKYGPQQMIIVEQAQVNEEIKLKEDENKIKGDMEERKQNHEIKDEKD
jgi:mevalonate pyrophosphate decarboxylase